MNPFPLEPISNIYIYNIYMVAGLGVHVCECVREICIAGMGHLSSILYRHIPTHESTSMRRQAAVPGRRHAKGRGEGGKAQSEVSREGAGMSVSQLGQPSTGVMPRRRHMGGAIL